MVVRGEITEAPSGAVNLIPSITKPLDVSTELPSVRAIICPSLSRSKNEKPPLSFVRCEGSPAVS